MPFEMPDVDRAALRPTIRRFEEITLNTAPAIHEYCLDGWLLRASGTATHRSNSVTILDDSTLAPSEKIQRCEAWFQQHQQPVIFRLNEALAPADLDKILAVRGYTKNSESMVMTLDCSGVRGVSALPRGIRLVDCDIAESLRALHQMKGNSSELAEREIDRQALWRGPQIVLNLRGTNGLVCTGMARIEDGHVGLFDIFTPVVQRGHGYAAILIQHLIAWGLGQRAHAAFLQVLEANQPAINVYEGLGFVPRYRYWSRVGPNLP